MPEGVLHLDDIEVVFDSTFEEEDTREVPAVQIAERAIDGPSHRAILAFFGQR